MKKWFAYTEIYSDHWVPKKLWVIFGLVVCPPWGTAEGPLTSKVLAWKLCSLLNDYELQVAISMKEKNTP